MLEDQEPKRSQRIYIPPGPEELRRRKRDADKEKIRLQGEQSDDDLALGHNGTYRTTQNWTPYYQGLLERAAAEGRALGRGAEEDMIGRMLTPPDPRRQSEPGYKPPQEVLDAIAIEEAEADVAAVDTPQDDSIEAREARLAAREATIAAKEDKAAREADLAAREAELDAREKALQQYRKDAPSVPQDLDDLDSLRAFRPKPVQRSETFAPGFSAVQPTWVGRKRMTPEERAEAEREGVAMFGDGSSNSAWSKLNSLDPVEETPASHRRVSNDPAQRINDILASRQRDYTNDADGRAQAAADRFAAQEQVQAEDAAGREVMRKEQEAYDARQAEAQATVDAFMKEQRGQF